ncbi:hypothetical protein [Enhygromyxa salina]|uniref:hypothetical protein n=1 Tax=Enhygromyxa salina TaxID=215803 RepID=UPI000D02624C|nr:hypothetical protein [Enhygromyxa salina]
MGDPSRISEVCALLERAWSSAPSMRLGQLIVVAIAPTQPCPQVFAAEDNRTRAGLERVLERGGARPPLPASDAVTLEWKPVVPLRPTTVTLAGAQLASFELGSLFCELLEVRFAGEYRHGSQGSPDAEAMVEHLAPLLARLEPDVVLLDFSQLRYRWGDGLLGVCQKITAYDAEFPIAVVTLGGPDSLGGLRSLGLEAHAEREAALADAKRLAVVRSAAIG